MLVANFHECSCMCDSVSLETTIRRHRNVVTIANHRQFNRTRWANQQLHLSWWNRQRLRCARTRESHTHSRKRVVHNYMPINANLSCFAPVEPFSKSRVIVHSLGSMARCIADNNRLIRNEMLFNMPFCNSKRDEKKNESKVVCSLFIPHHCVDRLFLPQFLSFQTRKSFCVCFSWFANCCICLSVVVFLLAFNSSAHSCSHSISETQTIEYFRTSV